MNGADRPRSMSWGEAVGLLLVAAAVGLIVWPATQSPEAQMPVPPGTPLPPLLVAGWVPSAERFVETDENPSSNPSLQGRGTEAPTREALAGKIVVIDCWATWCPPCRSAMPKLAKLYAQYQPLGVEFLGLTPEGEGDLPQISRFLGDVGGVAWPIGYGADPMFDMLGIDAFPTLIVFNPAGRAVWSGHDVDDLPDVLDQALAMKE